MANPIRDGSNGQLERKWIDKAANNQVTITSALPNGVDDGGFELNSLTDHWTTRGVAGTGTVAINSSSPILGTYDCKFNRGDQSYVGLEQPGKVDLVPGKTYGVIFKAGGDGGAVTDFRVSLEYVAAVATLVPVTWTKINGGDNTATANIWKPAITDANAWEEGTFVVSDGMDAGEYNLVLDQYDATDVFIDEVYLFEVIQPDALIIAGHNMAGGFPSGSFIGSYRCQIDRSFVTSSDYDPDALDLDDLDVDGDSPIYEALTVPTSIYPILVFNFSALAGKTWSASEIWIGERWTWDRFLSGDWEPVNQDIEVVSSVTIGGNKRVSERYQQKLRAGTIATLSDDETAKWESFIGGVGLSKPFWYYIQAISDLGLSGEIIFMRNRSTPKLPMNADRFRSADYNFEEVL